MIVSPRGVGLAEAPDGAPAPLQAEIYLGSANGTCLSQRRQDIVAITDAVPSQRPESGA
jgi:hypothetical protein